MLTPKSVLAVVAAAAAGLIIGAFAAPGSDPPPEQVTKVVAGPERTVTTTTEVPVTPTVCADSLDLAEQGLSLSGDAMTTVGKAFDAVSRLDTAGVQAATVELQRINGKITALTPVYQAAAASCREGQ